jgi:hypothetical protein
MGYRFYPADTLPAIVHHEVSYRAEAMQITVYELPKIPLLKPCTSFSKTTRSGHARAMAT